jgi:transposase
LIPGKIPSVAVQIDFRDKILNLISHVNETNDKIYFLDPMHQVHNNVNDYCWQFIGVKGTKQVKSNTGRRRLNIIGALDPLTFEQIIILTETNCDKELMCSYLTHIRKENEDSGIIYVILDNAGYNRSYEVQEIVKSLGIELIFLPPYCPNLNLIERLWKYFKKKIMKNKYYQTYDEFYDKVTNFFKYLMNNIEDLKTLLTLEFGIIKAN